MLRSAKQLQDEAKAFHPCAPDKPAFRGWITAAQEKYSDSKIAEVSIGTRFEACYEGIFNIALAVLNAAGWRSRSTQGHHAFTLEAACNAIGARQSLFDKVDAIRESRNQKYDGASRKADDLTLAQHAFGEFSELAVGWMQREHPERFKQ